MTLSFSPEILNRRTALRLGGGGIAAALGAPGLQSVGAAEAATLAANTAIVGRLFTEPLYAGNVELIRALYAKDFLDRTAWIQRTELALGLTGTPLTVVAFREAHPTLTVTLDPVVAQADLVAVVARWGGSHPPAGTHLIGHTLHVFRLAQGQVVEQWSAGWEWLTRLLQDSPPVANPLVTSRDR